MIVRYPLATSSWDEAEYEAMQEVIRSGNFTMGSAVARFEELFAKYNGSRYCVMVNSGSSANLLMIAALFFTKNPLYRLRPGDEVIVPAVSWSTTYYPLAQYGLKLRFVDIDLFTLNVDIARLESAITEHTRAVLAVNLLGNPNDFRSIQRILAGRDIVLLEDNCEALGAEFEGKKAGTFGCMGSYSGFFSHHISIMEGGMITTDDEELYHILLCLRAHGWTRQLPEVNHVVGRKSSDPFEESFRFVLPGYNVRPLELSGAIGIEQLKKLPALIEERRKNGERLQEVMSNHPDLIIQKEIGRSSWFGFSLVLRPSADRTRSEILDRLRQLGFETRPIVGGNFTKNEVIQYFNYDIAGDLVNAKHVDTAGLFVGNHHYPINDALEALASI